MRDARVHQILEGTNEIMRLIISREVLEKNQVSIFLKFFYKENIKIMEYTNKIYFQEHKKKDGSFLAEVRLTNSKNLNVLDLEMILSLKSHLEKWKKDPRISLVFISGEGGKAFCAGGDVKQLYKGIINCEEQSKDPGLFVQPFFENEYKTNYLMHTYPKPIVLWGNGIVMGGGIRSLYGFLSSYCY